MNKTLIIYKSKTGFTKKYAEIIAEETGSTVMNLKNATTSTLSGFDTIIFGGRVHAGVIDGLKQAKELFSKSSAKKLILFATGATPNTSQDVVQEMWKNNLSADELSYIPHFYMQGGLCYEKMGLLDKLIMKMVSSMTDKKKDTASPEGHSVQSLSSSFDISSKEYIRPLISYLSSEPAK